VPEFIEGLLDFSAFQQDCQGGMKRYIFLEFLSPVSLFKQRNRVAEGIQMSINLNFVSLDCIFKCP
jgi:hypothetical protein